MSKWCGDENCLQCADKEPDPYVHLPRADYEALREQNRVLATKLAEAAVLAKEIKDEFDMCTHECERCGESDPISTFDIYRAVVQLAALTATSQPGGTHEL